MTDWSPVFLGVIAVAVVVMACIQIGALVATARLAQRVTRLAERVEHDLAPVVANLQTIGAEVSARVEETVSTVQQAVMVPAREGLAIMAGLRAALASLREAWQAQPGRRASRSDEDDPLFIG